MRELAFLLVLRGAILGFRRSSFLLTAMARSRANFEILGEAHRRIVDARDAPLPDLGEITHQQLHIFNHQRATLDEMRILELQWFFEIPERLHQIRQNRAHYEDWARFIARSYFVSNPLHLVEENCNDATVSNSEEDEVDVEQQSASPSSSPAPPDGGSDGEQ